jgi:hypothetical protein
MADDRVRPLRTQELRSLLPAWSNTRVPPIRVVPKMGKRLVTSGVGFPPWADALERLVPPLNEVRRIGRSCRTVHGAVKADFPTSCPTSRRGITQHPLSKAGCEITSRSARRREIRQECSDSNARPTHAPSMAMPPLSDPPCERRVRMAGNTSLAHTHKRLARLSLHARAMGFCQYRNAQRRCVSGQST